MLGYNYPSVADLNSNLIAGIILFSIKYNKDYAAHGAARLRYKHLIWTIR